MIVRRLIKQGNSVVVSIPANYLKELGVSVGDYVILDSKPNMFLLIAKIKGLEKSEMPEPN